MGDAEKRGEGRRKVRREGEEGGGNMLPTGHGYMKAFTFLSYQKVFMRYVATIF